MTRADRDELESLQVQTQRKTAALNDARRAARTAHRQLRTLRQQVAAARFEANNLARRLEWEQAPPYWFHTGAPEGLTFAKSPDMLLRWLLMFIAFFHAACWAGAVR